jgi:hypothetical protein
LSDNGVNLSGGPDCASPNRETLRLGAHQIITMWRLWPSFFHNAENKMHPEIMHCQSAQMNKTPQLRRRALNAMNVLNVIDERQK